MLETAFPRNRATIRIAKHAKNSVSAIQFLGTMYNTRRTKPQKEGNSTTPWKVAFASD
jgi:hypothetical protein